MHCLLFALERNKKSRTKRTWHLIDCSLSFIPYMSKVPKAWNLCYFKDVGSIKYVKILWRKSDVLNIENLSFHLWSIQIHHSFQDWSLGDGLSHKLPKKKKDNIWIHICRLWSLRILHPKFEFVPSSFSLFGLDWLYKFLKSWGTWE